MKASRLHEGYYLGPFVKASPLHESSLKPTGSPHEGFSSSRRLSRSLVKAFPLHEKFSEALMKAGRLHEGSLMPS